MALWSLSSRSRDRSRSHVSVPAVSVPLDLRPSWSLVDMALAFVLVLLTDIAFDFGFSEDASLSVASAVNDNCCAIDGVSPSPRTAVTVPPPRKTQVLSSLSSEGDVRRRLRPAFRGDGATSTLAVLACLSFS